MIVLNFSHPLTDAQREQIEALSGMPIERVITVQTQFDEQQPFALQLIDLMAQIDLEYRQWQNEQIVVVLPSLNFIAALVLAELHGRMGYFPSIVRMRAIANSLPRRFEVAELLNLQDVRDLARTRR